MDILIMLGFWSRLKSAIVNKGDPMDFFWMFNDSNIF